MPENHVPDNLGHLDIDTVSSYVDRDLSPDDLALIAIHLEHCSACDREVLEIRTTVLLLAGLPQYEPRRSFCLGQEHARASRRRDRFREATTPAAVPLREHPGAPVSLPPDGRSGSWFSGLHVAAMVVGALLLLVTAGDLTGFVANAPSPLQLAAPTAAAGLNPPPQGPMPSVQAPQAAPEAPADADLAAGPGAANSFASFQDTSTVAGGTEQSERASQGMLESEEPATRLVTTVVGAAAVTQAIPTPGVGNASAGAAPTAKAVTSADRDPGDGRPSLVRIVQLALALALAWLIVSIAGARWVRRLR